MIGTGPGPGPRILVKNLPDRDFETRSGTGLIIVGLILSQNILKINRHLAPFAAPFAASASTNTNTNTNTNKCFIVLNYGIIYV